ncbi:insulinase family protein [Neptunicella marina]|uniref:Protease 3 n=1 Tax=Neptunicella marina TaxID=2125989 RepID=A0A8J6IWM5_9ALTE|nr:insulinase family protein [Neptunicella marina]MBC3766723.1 insulinase family protein [Neptunicella marina]
MIKSLYDHRSYHYFILENNLKVLVVQDTKCKKSAAAVSVNAGHFADPPQYQGLAHLLEHMIFQGSDAFPEANHLSQFIEQHGGHTNAYTGTEYSHFYFDVANDYFDEALQQFSAMLKSPSFTSDAIKKEITTIDAEFLSKQGDDLRRLYQVHKETCNQQHPFSQFSVGNQQTLPVDKITELKNALINHHQSFFTGSNATLCLISNHSVAQQMQLAKQYFSSLAQGTTVSRTLPALYAQNNLAVKLHINPKKDAKRLILTFATVPQKQDFKSKPLQIIGHILGEEGRGSLLCYLKEQNWATSMSAGPGITGSNFCDFNINLQLTDEGLNAIDAICNAIFWHIQLIRKQGLPDWQFAQYQQLLQLSFDFIEIPKSLDYANHLAGQLQHFDEKYILSGDALLQLKDERRFQQVLGELVPQNLRLKVIAQNLETNQIAKWYNTPYKIEPLSAKLIKQWSSPIPIDGLVLPKVNPYLCSNTSIVSKDHHYKTPQRLNSQPGLLFWFAQDHEFNMPKGDIYLSFDCPYSQLGVEQTALKRLWLATLLEQLNEQYYQAEAAGLYFHLYPHQGGFTLHTSGFSDKQIDLVKALIESIISCKLDVKRFEQTKYKQCVSAQNSLMNKPINRLFNRLSVLLQRNTHGVIDIAEQQQFATLKATMEAKQQLLNEFHLQAFMHGNWRENQAQDLKQYIQCTLGENASLTTSINRDIVDLRLTTGNIIELEDSSQDATVVMYFQSPSEAVEDIAMTMLAEQLLAGPFFNEMRTQKQLGYLLGTGYFPVNQHPGIAFYIQSPTASPNEMVDAINDFIHRIAQQLEEYPLERWEALKQAMIKQLSDKDQNLSMRSQRFWLSIAQQDWNFDQPKRLQSIVKKMTREQLAAFCQNMDQRMDFGEVILYCKGRHSPLHHPVYQSINDIRAFKNSAHFIP